MFKQTEPQEFLTIITHQGMIQCFEYGFDFMSYAFISFAKRSSLETGHINMRKKQGKKNNVSLPLLLINKKMYKGSFIFYVQ